MAGEELQLVRLKDDFYRDGFYKALGILTILIVGIILVVTTSIYLFVSKPAPVVFATDDEFRILPPVAIDKPYLSSADLVQWVSETMPGLFWYNFIRYDSQLKNNQQYFTENGWKKFLEQLNTYANTRTVQNAKQFINANAAGAPIILRQGLIGGRYGWWVQIPLNINYRTADRESIIPLVFQVLVVRVSTLNNLAGVAIDNMIVSKGLPDQVLENVGS